MRDGFGRSINYMRISVTDRCDFRCVYCMPAEGVEKRCHGDMLSFDEIVEIARAAAELGVTKLRITGGEPLVRKGVTELCRELSAIPGIRELCMTTNGALLAPVARELKAAGVSRLNVSLDTLDAEKFRRITRVGTLSDTLEGIRAAREAGFPLKLNCVLMGGVNDDEIEDFVYITQTEPIEVRFIELMPIGGGRDFGGAAFLPCSAVTERAPELRALSPEPSGVARLYALPGAKGRVGLISPLSEHFCGSCSRIRLTADGKLKPCLHSAEELPLRGLHGEGLKDAIRNAILRKPARHGELSPSSWSRAGRDMNEIGG